MANENNFVYFEGAKVTKTRSKIYYRIDLEDEDWSFFIKKEIVKGIISSSVEEESNLVAIMLAYVEYSRQCRNECRESKKAKKLEDDILINGFSALLYSYPVERLVVIFKSLKWHEITEILNSEDPISKMEGII